MMDCSVIDSRACTVRDSISQQEIRASKSALWCGRDVAVMLDLILLLKQLNNILFDLS